MYYLDEKEFQPLLILVSIVLLPCIIATIVIMCVDYDPIALYVFIALILVYVIAVVSIWFLSKRKNNYLSIMDNGMHIEYPNINRCTNKLDISFDQIVKIKYYKITSLVGWLMLYSFVLPKCVYIIYNKDDMEITDFIGYMDLKDIKDIANKNGLELEIH